MEINNNQLINVYQAARLLDTYPQKVYRFLKHKDYPLPHTMQGGHALFQPEKIIPYKQYFDIDYRRKENRKPKGENNV